MNVSVGPEFEAYIQKKVKAGDYASASEVVRDGLRMLRERDLLFEARLLELRGKIQEGIDQARAGRVSDGPSFMKRLQREGRGRRRRKT
jgi:antitoxin ParD1/3/4